MSKRRSLRRKSGKATIRASREHARALAPHTSAHELVMARAYPTAAELFAQGGGWRAYVSETLRTFLAPAAIAGAVGLAGCAGVGDGSSGVVTGDTTTVQSSATLTPINQPTIVTQPVNGGGGNVVVTPIPPVTFTPIPPGTPIVTPPSPPPINITAPPNVPPPRHPPAVPGGVGMVRVPPIPPSSRPPMVRGDVAQVQPAVDPPQVEGGMRAVDPIQPPVDPAPLAGSQPAVHVMPLPPPNPSPPAVVGQERVVRPADMLGSS